MAGVAQSFLSGQAAGKAAGLGELQTIEGVRTIVAQRDKKKRIQGLLGEHAGATPAEQFGIEQELYGIAPEQAAGVREFRTEGQQEMSSQLASAAVTGEGALGTPEEPQMMLHMGMVAEQYGVPKPEIQSILTQYSSLVGQDPDKATEYAGSVLGELITKGMAPEDAIKARNELKTSLAEEKRTLETTIAEEKREGKEAERLEGIKQKNRLDLERLKKEGKAAPIRDQKIADNMRLYGLSEEDATAVADGNMKVQTDPLSGQPSLVNVATGVSRPIQETVPDMPPAPASVVEPEITVPNVPEETVFDILGSGVGLQAVTKEALSTTVGQVFEGATFEETTRARTKIKALSEKLIFALSQSDRPPVIEQTRLMELLPSTGVFESESHARTSLTELHGGLSRQLIDDLAVVNDGSMSKKIRVESQMRAQAIKNMLRELGSPTGDLQTITTQEEYDALPSGSKYLTSDGKSARKP